MLHLPEWTELHTRILELEQEGLATRTFRRLDPERQLAVVHAILEEAVERGPTAINIKRIAHRAEVSVGSLYQYFHHREGVLSFAVALCARYLVDTMNRFRPLLAEMPLREGLESYVLGGLEWSRMQSGLMTFLARTAYHGDASLGESLVAPLGRVMQCTVTEMLQAARARGELRDELDLDATARILNVLAIAVSDGQLLPYLNRYYQLTDDTMSFERVLDALIHLVEAGIVGRPLRRRRTGPPAPGGVRVRHDRNHSDSRRLRRRR